MEIAVIDIEASGLSENSYPIEIGWSILGSSRYEGFLITPDEQWTHWDAYAQDQIHKISQQALALCGINAYEAAGTLNRILSGKLVISDAPGADRFWLSRLFEAAGVACQFTLFGLMDIIDTEHHELYYKRLRRNARSHRAGPDALAIQKILNTTPWHPDWAKNQSLQDSDQYPVASSLSQEGARQDTQGCGLSAHADPSHSESALDCVSDTGGDRSYHGGDPHGGDSPPCRGASVHDELSNRGGGAQGGVESHTSRAASVEPVESNKTPRVNNNV